jgi:AcrR family transcriptional regulator
VTSLRKRVEIQRRAPSQARARVTVEAILEAAARIIRRQGVDALTTNRIAEVAGVGIGTLYGYFPDKAAVMIALARRILDEDVAALSAALADSGESDLVRAVVRALIARHRTDPALRRTVMRQHIGMGFGLEHGRWAQQAIAIISERLYPDLESRPDPIRLFVITRAVLGVSRTLIEEEEASELPAAALEDELVRLVGLYLGRHEFPNPNDVKLAP